MINKKILKNSLIISHILFGVVGFGIYLINYNYTEQLLFKNALVKEHTITKAGALAIENFLTLTQNELNSSHFSSIEMSNNPIVEAPLIHQVFTNYIQETQLPINGIAYYDTTGKLSIIEDRENLKIGENQDFSKTPYILWTKNPLNKNKLFVSTPYIGVAGGSVGKIILLVIKPLYLGNTYKGAIGMRILVDELRNSFINPLISEKNEDSFIVDSNGVMIAGRTALLNKNLFRYAQQQKWNGYMQFITALHQAIQKNDTQTTWFFQNPGEKPQEVLVGISKIDIPNTEKDLYMIVTTPKSNIFALLSLLRDYGYIWLGFSALLTTIGSSIVILLQEY